eukprot:CAMPEP_0119551902 /NCGR_PEP_ID=MMETSP1352-20130426/5031_1 /TAXON_ID=265584 /ORGANISM="Stauroneis constricta, Strain CCMP1120" /LENGTH=732 /DNA_ID=CAMNT_0007598027 /DNA_START=291 /DNA_END=2489 /DNA_ORIENTATION=-
MSPAAGDSATRNGQHRDCHHSDIDVEDIKYRHVHPTDVRTCLELEQSWKPPNESSSKNDLQYRQHHAARFFRCAIYYDEHDDHDHHGEDDPSHIIGFICATRCQSLDQIMSPVAPVGGSSASPANGRGRKRTDDDDAPHAVKNYHDIHGPLLVLHSVVLRNDLRHYSHSSSPAAVADNLVPMLVANMLKEYVANVYEMIRSGMVDPVERIVRIIHPQWLQLYIQSGFNTITPAKYQRHGYYMVEHKLSPTIPRNVNNSRVSCSSLSVRSNSGIAIMEQPPDIATMDHPCYIVDAFCCPSANADAPEETAEAVDAMQSSSALDQSVASSDGATAASGTGNPAAVVILPPGVDPTAKAFIRWSQTVAAEFNLSETAFLIPKSSDDEYLIRYFTPTVEIGLCGHATLASAAVLFQRQEQQQQQQQTLAESADENARNVADASSSAIAKAVDAITFHARNNVLVMKRFGSTSPAALTTKSQQQQQRQRQDSKLSIDNGASTNDIATPTPTPTSTPKTTKISMEFPLKPPTEIVDASEKSSIIGMLQQAFGIETIDPKYIGISRDIGDVLVELKYEDFQCIGNSTNNNRDNANTNTSTSTSTSTIDFAAFLQNAVQGYTRGVIVCCVAEPLSNQADDEDTYSNHSDCASSQHTVATVDGVDFYSRFFGPKAGIDEDPVTGSAHCILAPYFANKLDKTVVVGKQMSKRGGIVDCQVKEDGTVVLSGVAKVVMNGMLSM